MTTHETPFGTVETGETSVSIRAHAGQLYVWSHRPGYSWPCSALDDLDAINCAFDSNGLFELAQVPDNDYDASEPTGPEISGDGIQRME